MAGRYISDYERQREREQRKTIPTDTYRRPFVLVGKPGSIKNQRYVYDKKAYVNVRHKTLVVLECGHGKVHLDTVAQRDKEIDSVRLAELRSIYGPLEYGTWVATKDVHPLVDLSPEEQAAMVEAGKSLPRPLRSMTCQECLHVAVETKKAEEKEEYEARRAEWIKSGQKAALDAYVAEAEAKQAYWEELDMAVYDELEGRIVDTVTDALAKIGIDSTCLDVMVDDEGGLPHPSEGESIPTPIGTTYVNRFSDEDLEGLGRSASFKSVTIKLDRDGMVTVLTALGQQNALKLLDTAMTKDEVLVAAEQLLADKRAAREQRSSFSNRSEPGPPE